MVKAAALWTQERERMEFDPNQLLLDQILIDAIENAPLAEPAAEVESQVAAIGTSLTNPVSSDWVRQLGVWLNGRYPRRVTLCNEGVGGSASKYTSVYTLAKYPGKKSGVDYQLGQVLASNPDVLFIEFPYNDAFTDYGISVATANANLQEMIDTSRNWAAAGKPLDSVVQTMNIDPTSLGSTRPYYPDYYQGYREIAASNSVLLVDNYPAWLDLYSSKRTVYDGFMSDTYHPYEPGEL